MRLFIAGSVAALVSFASTVNAQDPAPTPAPAQPPSVTAAATPPPGPPSLVAISGQVLVNRGNGFELAQPGLVLKPGDLVVANPGATAQVMYPQGCLVPVVPGQVVSVVEKPKCPPLTTGVLPAAAAAAAAAGGAGAAGISTAALVGGGAAAAGGGAAAYALSKSKSSSSDSTSTSTSTPGLTPSSASP
ncbi:MAG: hypothetical protein EKK41_21070 [Hyphomicrobiales bacterium]|nr:MAG: hypothetical protein EKK41_21070 [Hyphomicrobiales bacterium]